MSLRPEPVPPIPEETARVARAAFPKGALCLRMRDTFETFFTDDQFAALFPTRGQPAQTPWRLALVTVLQFAENLSDRQAADAVRSRIDWKYLLALPLTDPGFDFSLLSEFRDRLVEGSAELLLFEGLLRRFQEQKLVKARTTQRTDATHVLTAVRTLSRLELVGESMRAALNALAVADPAWVVAQSAPEWIERYGRRRLFATGLALALSVYLIVLVIFGALKAPRLLIVAFFLLVLPVATLLVRTRRGEPTVLQPEPSEPPPAGH